MGLFKKIKKVAKKAKKTAEKVVDKGKDAVEDINPQKEIMGILDDAKRQLFGAVDKAKGEVSDVANEAKNEVRDVAKDVKDEIPELAEKAVKEAVSELSKAISKEGLKAFRGAVRESKNKLDSLSKNRPDWVDSINELSIYLNLGPATLTWSGFYSRSDYILSQLDKHISNPPKFSRRNIVSLIENLGPTVVNLGISVNFALVIGSKELGVGGGIGDIPLKIFTELGDVILKELGVPE